MAFNGSGVFVRLYNWVADAAANIKIRADRMDAEMDGLATGLSNCITKDGQTTVTANLPMATYKHTGVGAASSATDYMRADQAQSNGLIYFTATGTDTYAITPSPAISAYAAGQSFLVLFTNANTGAATLNVSSLGAKALEDRNGNALVAGDIIAGSIVRCDYDGTNFQITPTTLAATMLQSNAVTTPKINNNAVTLAKMADIDGSSGIRLLGRTTASSGDPELVVVIDDDSMATASNTNISTSEAVKAYTDAHGIVQHVYNIDSAVATGTTTLPLDDTIPQNTEGDQYLSQAITPTNTNNILQIEVELVFTTSLTGNQCIAALFQDSTADALAAAVSYAAVANGFTTMRFTHYMVAGTTSATTFKVRLGGNSASTITLNGFASGRSLGGVMSSSISIKEIKV